MARRGRRQGVRAQTDQADIEKAQEDWANRDRGRDANRTGKLFENALENAHEVYAAMGFAMIEQRPVDTSPMPPSYLSRLGTEKVGPRARQLSKRAGFDFFGTMGPWAGPDEDLGMFFGRSIAMESKNSQSKKTLLPISGSHLKNPSGGLQEHQLRALVQFSRDFGGVAVLVWNNGGERMVLLPPYLDRALDDFIQDKAKSIPAGWFTPYKVIPSVTVWDGKNRVEYRDVEDWMQPVFAWLEKGLPTSDRTKIKNPRGEQA